MTTTPPTPDQLHAALLRAEQLFSAGQPAEAARLLEPVVDAVPDSTAVLELQARALFAAAQLTSAEAGRHRRLAAALGAPADEAGER